MTMAEMAQLFRQRHTRSRVEASGGVDEEQARQRLEALAPQMSQPAKDANLRVENGQLSRTMSWDIRSISRPPWKR
jgi:hypothetical protein